MDLALEPPVSNQHLAGLIASILRLPALPRVLWCNAGSCSQTAAKSGSKGSLYQWDHRNLGQAQSNHENYFLARWHGSALLASTNNFLQSIVALITLNRCVVIQWLVCKELKVQFRFTTTISPCLALCGDEEELKDAISSLKLLKLQTWF